MRSSAINFKTQWLKVLLGTLLLAAPMAAGAESYDYQDYRDAGYFDDGFYDDDWFYDWYDTGFYHGTGNADFSHYYESTDQKSQDEKVEIMVTPQGFLTSVEPLRDGLRR